MPARILIVDDHEIVREGIRTLISRSRPEWEICGEAINGAEAIEAAQALKPDVIILDITMPGVSGLEAASKITSLGLGSRILMFTMHDSERLYVEAREAKAQGVVLKSQAARDLIRAIDHLLQGGTFFASETQLKPKDAEPPPRGPFEARSGLCAGQGRRGPHLRVASKPACHRTGKRKRVLAAVRGRIEFAAHGVTLAGRFFQRRTIANAHAAAPVFNQSIFLQK
jgi:DNA-binding NarL/FixJ family response regulator